MKWLALFFLAAFLSLPGCQKGSTSNHTQGEIIIEFKQGAFSQDGTLISRSINGLNDRFGLVRIERLFGNVYKMEFPANTDIDKLATIYARDSLVVYAEPNYIVHAVEKK